MRRAGTALAAVLLVLLVEAGCGSGPSTPTPPTGPGTPPPGGGALPQPVGTLTRGPYLQHADERRDRGLVHGGARREGRVRWSLDDDTVGRGGLLGGDRPPATRP